MAQERQILEIPDFLTVRDLAERMHASPIEVMKELISNGIMASINQQIDYDTAAIVADGLGFEARPLRAVKVQPEEEGEKLEWRKVIAEEDASKLKRRPPVVTILGHVDHGKTSLLDVIRHTNVTAAEAGGITQHIGAYQGVHNGQTITFLDTPGHEAFTAMRARGAQGADIAVLVVAADDGVMPTTREALAHVRAAHVPVVVALNKIDKANANPERVKQQLAEELDLKTDEWGGDTLVVPVSAVTQSGIPDLLEAILMTAEETEILANPDANASGTVLEGRMEAGRGPLATLLVQNGTLHTGDMIVAGLSHGRVKAMFDYTGASIKSAGPSVPVLVMGLDMPPHAGERFEVMKNVKEARALVEERRLAAAESARQPVTGLTLEEVFARFQAGETKELLLIVKVDVDGSLEPVVHEIEGIEVGDLGVRVLHADVGEITENDVNLASASKAIIVGFNVEPDSAAARLAESKGVDIRTYKIIYQLREAVELALHGLLEPVYADKLIGVAEVRQLFRVPRVGTIAGSYVLEGTIRRNAKARVMRQGNVIVSDVSVRSLKRFEDDVREVRTGFECGIGLEGFNDFVEGDRIEFYVRERVS